MHTLSNCSMQYYHDYVMCIICHMDAIRADRTRNKSIIYPAQIVVTVVGRVALDSYPHRTTTGSACVTTNGFGARLQPSSGVPVPGSPRQLPAQGSHRSGRAQFGHPAPQAGWHCFTYSLSSTGTCETFPTPALLEVYLKLCHSTCAMETGMGRSLRR